MRTWEEIALSSERSASASIVLDAAPCRLVLPAGCGKTQLIAEVAAEISRKPGRTLLLTHTHAGVDALRRRLKKLDVPRDAVELRTIASWAVRLSEAYPRTAEYATSETPNYEEANEGAVRALQNPHVAGMIALSYDFIAVDEYQDCTLGQHEVIKALGEIRPVMVFGDPLQAIYDFGDNELIDWDRDLAALRPVTFAPTGWRWRATNPELGECLLDIRRSLEAGQPIDLRSTPAIRWVPDDPTKRVNTLLGMAGADGSVAILDRFDQQCEAAARPLKGRFQVMEDLKGHNLLEVASVVDQTPGPKASGAVLRLAKASHIALPQSLVNKIGPLAEGQFPKFQSGESASCLEALKGFAAEPSGAQLLAVIAEIDRLGRSVCRREAWRDFGHAARAWSQGEGSLTAAVTVVRQRGRVIGRRPASRTISRPLLVKGQEFDHVVVLGATAMSTRELYVSLTRGSTSLTVISNDHILTPTDSGAVSSSSD